MALYKYVDVLFLGGDCLVLTNVIDEHAREDIQSKGNSIFLVKFSFC